MPLQVTQSHTEFRYGSAVVSLLFQASGNTGTVNWTASSGTLSAATGLSTILTPANQTELVTITAQDAATTVVKTIQIWATLPVQPKWGVESDVDLPLARWPMAYQKRTFAEYAQMLDFFQWHQPAIVEVSESENGSMRARVARGRPFYVDDYATGELAKVYFDSAFRRGAQGADWIDYAFQLLSFEYVIVPNPVSGPWAGTALDPYVPGGAGGVGVLEPEYGEAEYGDTG